VKAREVVALGTIQGNVEATEKIEIRKDAKLTGDIRTARIIIEDGAYFKGSIDIVKPEPAKGAPKMQASVPAAPSIPAAAGAPETKR
jgi:cytoskeletal protein CcmA (bactofilin family)